MNNLEQQSVRMCVHKWRHDWGYPAEILGWGEGGVVVALECGIHTNTVTIETTDPDAIAAGLQREMARLAAAVRREGRRSRVVVVEGAAGDGAFDYRRVGA